MSWHILGAPHFLDSDYQPKGVAVENTETHEKVIYEPAPPTCTIECRSIYDEDYGIYTCSNCGQKWQFDFEGPKGNGWTCCPHCRAVIA